MNRPARMEGPACQVRFLGNGLSISSPSWRARQACPSEVQWTASRASRQCSQVAPAQGTGRGNSRIAPRVWRDLLVRSVSSRMDYRFRLRLGGHDKRAPPGFDRRRRGRRSNIHRLHQPRELVGAIHELPLPRCYLVLVSAFWAIYESPVPLKFCSQQKTGTNHPRFSTAVLHCGGHGVRWFKSRE